MMSHRFIYKGFEVEIGELPGPRQSYWRRVGTEEIYKVECGSWQDLELIAKRGIDRIIENGKT